MTTTTKTAKSAKASPAAVNGNGAAKGLKKLVKQPTVPTGAEFVRLSQYFPQDGKPPVPTIEFGQADDRWAFSFGAGKAKRMLAAVDEVGIETVLHMLRQLAGQNGNGNGAQPHV